MEMVSELAQFNIRKKNNIFFAAPYEHNETCISYHFICEWQTFLECLADCNSEA